MALSSSQLAVLFLLTFGFIVCLVGTSAPYWEYQDLHENSSGVDARLDIGLYYACAKVPVEGYHDCILMPWDIGDDVDNDIYFKVTRVLMAGSVFFLAVGVLVAISTCCKKSRAHSIAFESVMGFLGGIIGVAGLATFSSYAPCEYNPFADKFHMDEPLNLDFGFAYYLNCASCGFVIITGLMGFCAPKRRIKNTESTSLTSKRYSNPGYKTLTQSRQESYEHSKI